MGALQHQLIGERMVRNFPQVLAPGSNSQRKIDDSDTLYYRRWSTSLTQSTNNLSKSVLADASNADMRYMNFDDTTE